MEPSNPLRTPTRFGRLAMSAAMVAVAMLLVFACGSSKGHPPLAGLIGDDSGVVDAGPCSQQTQLDNDGGLSLIGQRATLVGRVLDPAGKVPLYNINVYVPKSPILPPLSKGVTCDHCGAKLIDPQTSTITDQYGTFALPDVPNGPQKLVVQVGKWRKVVPIDVQGTCVMVGDVSLPKNGQEGDLPDIAVTLGEADALECLLRGIGVSESEFVPGAGGAGHVHMFNGFGGMGPAGTPDAQSALWNDLSKLSAYDMVLLSCEGDEHNENKTNPSAIHDYASLGGRVFATHYHYTWMKNGTADFQTVADWSPGVSGIVPEYNVNMTFPKGAAFAEWLENVGASTHAGHIPLKNIKNSVRGVNAATTQDWIDADPMDVKYFSFNTPLSAAADKQCGRVVFSDIHVFSDVSMTTGEVWPTGCGPLTDLNPQQKALEFLLFDLSACVEPDSQAPSAVH